MLVTIFGHTRFAFAACSSFAACFARPRFVFLDAEGAERVQAEVQSTAAVAAWICRVRPHQVHRDTTRQTDSRQRKQCSVRATMKKTGVYIEVA